MPVETCPITARVNSSLLYGLFMAVIFAALSGCSVGPEYIRPSVSEPKVWIDETNPAVNTAKSDLTEWWTVFQDPILNELIEKAYSSNPGLQIAGLRILEARAELGILVGNQYPQQQQLTGSVGAVGLSENNANTVTGGDFRYGEIGIGFDAGWEMDFWGKFTRAVSSGVNTLDSTIADFDNTLVTLTAEVARTYMVLRTFEEQLKIAEENVRIQKRSLKIASVRFEGGDVTELDVAQAQTLLSNTLASVPRLQAQIRQTKNGIAVLLGILPVEIEKIFVQPAMLPHVPAEIVVGIPAEMLRRRPDIRRVEHQMLAQSELIGVAQADLYPHFSLVGAIGLRSTDSSITSAGGSGGSSLGDLFHSNSFEYFIGPTFSWDILNYGRIKNRVRIEDARFQQLTESYRNTILEAAQEAEDALVAFLRSQEEQKYLGDSAVAASRSVDLAMLQYKEGLNDYQRVLETQRSLISQQDQYAANRGRTAIDLISLYKALGGGWESRIGKPFIPEATREQMEERTDWGDLLQRDELESTSTENGTQYLLQPAW
jgi:NodT family efflux transporter outer membrane factor (OMF) lipoprotein